MIDWRELDELTLDKGGIDELVTNIEALLRVVKAAKIANDVLERVVDSFPDNETPHPSVEECLNAYGGLDRELEALPEHLR